MSSALLILAILNGLQLPPTSEKQALSFDHFPTPVHAFVWRNWPFIPVERMAAVVDAQSEDIARMGAAMGLGVQATIPEVYQRRGYISIIRRNWHLLPYDQLLMLLGWTEEQLAFTLREDDFLYIKLGSMKPKCSPLKYAPPTEAVRARETEIASTMTAMFPEGPATLAEPLFHFVKELSTPPTTLRPPPESAFSPRYCSSYFALFGDPLSEPDLDAHPDGYLDRLVMAGVDGMWMHAVLYKLAPFPWDESLSEGYETRLRNLDALTRRAAKKGIGFFLYMNEPRAMPLAFFDDHPELKGAVEGDHAALCTSAPEVREYIAASIARICEAAPLLRGIFTITASENFTNCWSHGNGAACARCGLRLASEVIAEVNSAIQDGIARAGADTQLIAWDWGWRDDWALDAIARLPKEAALMSVSEWSIPITRGGVDGIIGEYSISTIGPGPRATKHWAAAQARGLKTMAKIQAGNTWELSAVPYIPAVANVAQHAANLNKAGVNGLMLGWSLGGYPSPNLEVVAEMASGEGITPDEAMLRVASRRYGEELAEVIVAAWKQCSVALSEFPFDGGVVYRAPIQMGPANLLWSESTDYASTMVGLPYDDLTGWRGHYPEEVFIGQFQKMADGFEAALKGLRAATKHLSVRGRPLAQEMSVIEAAGIHYRSVETQARYVRLRNAMQEKGEVTAEDSTALQSLIALQRDLAVRQHRVQRWDSRIGYESSNHYFYVPIDLAETALSCSWLLGNKGK